MLILCSRLSLACKRVQEYGCEIKAEAQYGFFLLQRKKMHTSRAKELNGVSGVDGEVGFYLLQDKSPYPQVKEIYQSYKLQSTGPTCCPTPILNDEDLHFPFSSMEIATVSSTRRWGSMRQEEIHESHQF